jgi:hypothetical protein
MMISWFQKLRVTKKKKAPGVKHLIISYCLNFEKGGNQVVVDWLNGHNSVREVVVDADFLLDARGPKQWHKSQL